MIDTGSLCTVQNGAEELDCGGVVDLKRRNLHAPLPVLVELAMRSIKNSSRWRGHVRALARTARWHQASERKGDKFRVERVKDSKCPTVKLITRIRLAQATRFQNNLALSVAASDDANRDT
eukprot:390144-Pleurochrysis_carterae.AAC.1